MARLKLNPDPTFFIKAVAIPVPGGESDVGLTFKYRDGPSIAAWLKEHESTYNVDLVLDCVTGWDLEEEFNREHVQRMCDLYPGAAAAIVTRYLKELSGNRRGN